MARRIPWEGIRLAYVQGVEREGKRVYPTMRDLAEQYDVRVSDIGRVAKSGNRDVEGNWVEARELFANRLRTETEQQTIAVLSETGSKLDVSAVALAQVSIERILSAMNPNTGQNKLSADDFAKLSTAAKNFHQMGRLALGLTTDEQGIKGVKLEDWFR